jgi:hypothetical protein
LKVASGKVERMPLASALVVRSFDDIDPVPPRDVGRGVRAIVRDKQDREGAANGLLQRGQAAVENRSFIMGWNDDHGSAGSAAARRRSAQPTKAHEYLQGKARGQ